MRAFGYVRSMHGQPAALSLEGQRAAVDAACVEAGWTLDATFEDVSLLRDQGAFLDLIDALDRSETESVVLVGSVGVLADDAAGRWRRALQLTAAGGRLVSADGADAESELLAGWERRADAERRRERAQLGMRRRALRGEVLGRPPYGYRVERMNDGGRRRSRLVPDPAEAEIVRRIFHWCLGEGEGVRRIAARLNAEGIPTRSGKPWNLVSVRNLLRNPVYTGIYERLGVRIPGAHQAIVPLADFRAVQRALDARRSPGARHAGGRPPAAREEGRGEYLFAGLAYCGYCGARLVGGRRRGPSGTEHRYYRCAAALNQGRCGYHSHRGEELEWQVRHALGNNQPLTTPLLATPAPEDGGLARERALHRSIDRMVERRVSGQWTADQLRRRAAPLARALLQIEMSRRPGARRGRPAPAGADEARRRLVEDWERLEEPVRRTLLLQVVREIVVTDSAVRVTLA